MSRKKRKQNFVDSSVQGSLLRRIIVHWLIFFFVVTLSSVALQALLGDPSKPLLDRMAQELKDFYVIGIVIGSLFPAFLLDTIRFSNRFVGPITRLRRQLRELAETGETAELKFRDNDFWVEIANEFNEVRARVMNLEAEKERRLAQPADARD